MGSDLSTIFPLVIFLTLMVVLAGFFYVTDDIFELQDWNPDELPIYKTMVNESSPASMSEDDFNWGSFAISILAFLGGAACILHGNFVTAAFLIGTGITFSINSSAQGQAFLSGLPLIGQLMNGINYIGTALASFWDVLFWSPNWLHGIPILSLLIVAPIGIFIFIFILRFIRGQ